jgi:threonine dehydratase
MHAPLPDLAELDAAAALIAPLVPPTPQYRWPLLEARLGARCTVKHENHTPVGAFKVRGGPVYLDWLRRTIGDVPGIVTATRGNHGQSVGFACARAGVPACVVVPRGNAAEKNAAMRALGVELVEAGDDFQASVEAADAIARERGWHRMPSFHRALVAGVGTYALELLRAVPDLERVYVPIGMGSGACGMLAAKAALGHPVQVIGVTSAHARATALSLASGTLQSQPAETVLADGVACRTPVAEALHHLAAGLAGLVEVTDDEVADAMRAFVSDTHNLAEGAAAASLAAAMQERESIAGRHVGVICCGGNVDRAVAARILAA